MFGLPDFTMITTASIPIRMTAAPIAVESGIFPNSLIGFLGFEASFEGACFGGTYAPLYGAPQFLHTFSVSYIS